MASFLALYRGESIGGAELVAVSTDRDLVGRFADELLMSDNQPPSQDPARKVLWDGKRRALEIVRDEAEQADAQGDQP